MLAYLAARTFAGVESVTSGRYARTLGRGWMAATVEPGAIMVSTGGGAGVAEAATVAGRIFDAGADPRAIGAVLGPDPLLGPLWSRLPGLRIPGTADGFELACRAVLGQQVSVSGARTLANRLVTAFGRPVRRGERALTHLFPTAPGLASAPLERIGLPAARAGAIRALAAAVARGELRLEPGGDAAAARERLLALPGIGPWTADYVALRALRDRDAFPAADLGLRRALARLGIDPGGVAAVAERWRPWRGYAAMLLWWSETPPPG